MVIYDFETLYDRDKYIIALDKGIDPNSTGFTEDPIIIHWIKKGGEDVVLLLLEKGANISPISEGKETLLQLVVENSLINVVKKLLAMGADPNLIHDVSTPTPLFRAVRKGNEKLVKLLIKHSADVNFPSYANETPLMSAAENGHYSISELLIMTGADVNSSSSSGWTPLMHAAMGGYVSIAELLIRNQAEPLVKDKSNMNATDHARHRFDPILAQGFRDLGIPDIYVIDDSISVNWEPNSTYEIFISYKQMHFANDVDELRKYFTEVGKSVFVDRYDLNLNDSAPDNIEDVKVKLRKALLNTPLTVFFEIYWDGAHGESELSHDSLNWQYFELLHSKNAVLVSVENKTCDELIITPGKRLQSKHIFDFDNYKELTEQIVSRYFD